MKIKIEKNYYSEKEVIYEKDSIDLKNGLTVLVGCNGSGKTTMLQQIEQHCKEKKIPVLKFDNLHEGGSSSLSAAGFFGDTNFLVEGIISSEGEVINMNIGKFAGKMGNFVRKHSDSKQLVFLLDAIDSGLSIDYILELKNQLFKTVMDDLKAKGVEVYIVASANEYELVRGEQCLDVISCEYVNINTYDDYRKVVIESRKKKNKRYGWEEFELR